MDDAALHVEALHVGSEESGRIAHQAVAGVAYLSVDNLVAVGRRMEGDAPPLSAHAVVRQIVEHVVQPVATQRRAVSQQRAIDVDAGLVVEIERRTPQRQRGSRVDAQSAIDDDGLAALYQRVMADDDVAQQQRIPRPATQADPLLHAALEGEQEVVLDHLGLGLIILRGRQLHEDADTVALAHLEVGDDGAQRIVEIGAVDVDAESRLVALPQPDAAQAQSVARAVVDPEVVGPRPDGGEDGVHQHRVG